MTGPSFSRRTIVQASVGIAAAALVTDGSTKRSRASSEAPAPDEYDDILDQMEGDGSETAPYLITDIVELQAVAGDLQAVYELESDIDASGTEDWNHADEFTESIGSLFGDPAGTQFELTRAPLETLVDTDDVDIEIVDADAGRVELGEETTAPVEVVYRTESAFPLGFQPLGEFDVVDALGFRGCFDGEGHSIDGLFIDRPNESQIGLISTLDAAGDITGVVIEDATISGGRAVGTLVGWNEGTVQQSSAAGTVTGGENEDFIGGLIGNNNGTLQACAAETETTGFRDVGGLAGTNSEDGLVERCYARGTVEGEEFVGGLIGDTVSTVRNSYAAAAVQGEEFVGGLIRPGVDIPAEESYWDTAVSNQTSSGGGEGLDTTEMQGAAVTDTMDALDFEDTWATVADPDDYPMLQWQDEPDASIPVQANLHIQTVTIDDIPSDESIPVEVSIEETTGVVAAEAVTVMLSITAPGMEEPIDEQTIDIGEIEDITTATFGEDDDTTDIGPFEREGEYEATVEVAAANAETTRTSASFSVNQPPEELTAEDFITRDEAGNVEDVEVFDAIDDFRGGRLESGELFDVIDAFREA